MAMSASATDMIPYRRRRRAAAAWRRPRRRPAPVPGRARTFHRPVDRDQSQSLPVAASFCRTVRPLAGSCGCRRARRGCGAQPMALLRRRMLCLRRGRRFCCRWSPVWCRAGRAAVLAPTYPEFRPRRGVRRTSRRNGAQARRVRRRRTGHCRQPQQSRRQGSRHETRCSRWPKTCAAAAACSWSTKHSWTWGRPRASLAGDVSCGNVVVLRSFGKFFGLAGMRLGFALAAPALAARLRAALGPWAVSGPALAVGAKALADLAWIGADARRLAKAAKRLDAVLTDAGLRHRRRHDPVPAGADAGGGGVVSSSGACRDFCARLPRRRDLAALWFAGQRIRVAALARRAVVVPVTANGAAMAPCTKTGQIGWHWACSPPIDLGACSKSGNPPPKTMRKVETRA